MLKGDAVVCLETTFVLSVGDPFLVFQTLSLPFSIENALAGTRMFGGKDGTLWISFWSHVVDEQIYDTVAFLSLQCDLKIEKMYVCRSVWGSIRQ